MLTRFFSTAKPISTVVVLIYMTLCFFWVNTEHLLASESYTDIIYTVAGWMVYLGSMFVFEFIARRNDLTKRNAYKIVLFAAFTACLPVALQSNVILISGLAVIFMLRRLISLRSGKLITQKLFDAGFWLGIAAIIYFGNILFGAVIFFTAFIYAGDVWKHWLVPVLGFLAVVILFVCYQLLTNDTLILEALWQKPSFDFSAYAALDIVIAVALFITVFLWTIWSYLKSREAVISVLKPLFSIILLFTLISLLIVVLTPKKNGAEWYFATIPLAIIVTNYIERVESLFFKESLLWLCVMAPVIIYLI